jgi:hypothetical protein
MFIGKVEVGQVFGIISQPIHECVEAAEFGVGASEHIFCFGWQLVD